MDVSVDPAIPILRMFDVAAATRFYVEYLGCTVDWQDGDGDRPVYMQVSRVGLVLHLSSHHDDGTPGGAVLVQTRGVDALTPSCASAAIRSSSRAGGPGPGGGREMQLIDPASNRLRFYERPAPP